MKERNNDIKSMSFISKKLDDKVRIRIYRLIFLLLTWNFMYRIWLYIHI